MIKVLEDAAKEAVASAEFQEALWEVASDRVPRPGTPVTLIIERAR